MMNRKSCRVLITLVLAAAIFSAIGTEARAASGASAPSPGATSNSSTLIKPTPGPLSGEPDVPQGGVAPPKTGTYPTGGGLSVTTTTNWALRVQWMVRTWLEIVPKRFP
ncbi:MAG TPA: hypothetical protein VI504_15125 [Candidatus Eisenbacteria bacterium]|jgi:hypothetical protein